MNQSRPSEDLIRAAIQVLDAAVTVEGLPTVTNIDLHAHGAHAEAVAALAEKHQGAPGFTHCEGVFVSFDLPLVSGVIVHYATYVRPDERPAAQTTAAPKPPARPEGRRYLLDGDGTRWYEVGTFAGSMRYAVRPTALPDMTRNTKATIAERWGIQREGYESEITPL